MKTKYLQFVSILLAGLLQVAPMLRNILPSAAGLAPSAWGFILKIGLGAAAVLEFDSVSQASSISISPPNATVGVQYFGTISYSGGHAGSVGSMTYSNACLSGQTAFLTASPSVIQAVTRRQSAARPPLPPLTPLPSRSGTARVAVADTMTPALPHLSSGRGAPGQFHHQTPHSPIPSARWAAPSN